MTSDPEANAQWDRINADLRSKYPYWVISKGPYDLLFGVHPEVQEWVEERGLAVDDDWRTFLFTYWFKDEAVAAMFKLRFG